MKGLKGVVSVLLVLGMVFCFSISSFAEDEKPTADFSVEFASKYVWRGFELSKDSLMMFPSMTVGYKGFWANVWGAYDTDVKDSEVYGSETGDSDWEETDFSLGYDYSFKNLNFELGWTYYDYDTDPGSNQEVYLQASYDWTITPTITVYREIQRGNNWYVLLNLSYTKEFKNGWSVDLGGSASYMYLDDEDYSALHNGQLDLDLNIPFAKYFTLTPAVHYSFPLSDDAKDLIQDWSYNGHDSDFFWAGITLDMSF